MSKHTPGPWTAKTSVHDNRVVLIDSKVNGAVGELIFCDTRKAADARLIAAAPDLFKSLAAMVEMMDSGDEHGAGSEWHTQASAALAKAKGESA